MTMTMDNYFCDAEVETEAERLHNLPKVTRSVKCSSRAKAMFFK